MGVAIFIQIQARRRNNVQFCWPRDAVRGRASNLPQRKGEHARHNDYGFFHVDSKKEPIRSNSVHSGVEAEIWVYE